MERNILMDMMLWNLILSMLVLMLGYFLREKAEDLRRMNILLNRTREEIAKEYVTKTEAHHDLTRILDRLEALDEKLERLIRS
jgi:uncharacterized membrane protein